MKTAERWVNELEAANEGGFDCPDEIEEIIEQVQLEAFKAGMEHAATVKRHWAPNECDGVDIVRRAIREEIKKLKELPCA